MGAMGTRFREVSVVKAFEGLYRPEPGSAENAGQWRLADGALLWTGWKTSIQNNLVSGQWIAVVGTRRWYSNTGGVCEEYSPGDTFDLTQTQAIRTELDDLVNNREKCAYVSRLALERLMEKVKLDLEYRPVDLGFSQTL